LAWRRQISVENVAEKKLTDAFDEMRARRHMCFKGPQAYVDECDARGAEEGAPFRRSPDAPSRLGVSFAAADRAPRKSRRRMTIQGGGNEAD
jgi:hypothetical protein